MFNLIRRSRAGFYFALILVNLLFIGAAQKYTQRETEKSLAEKFTPTQAEAIVRSGMKAFPDRDPREWIRGMISPEYPTYDVPAFRAAALTLAENNDPRAQYLLGWISQFDATQASSLDRYDSKIFSSLDGLDLSGETMVAAKWYLLASNQGLAVASTQMGRLLQSYSHNENGLSNTFFERGAKQGDKMAILALASSYAYGTHVAVDHVKAWRLLEPLIYGHDREIAISATSTTVMLWKDKKISPPNKFTRGAPNAVAFLNQFDPSIDQYFIDYLYSYSGFTPDPMPLVRRAFAVRALDADPLVSKGRKKQAKPYRHFEKSGQGIITFNEDGWPRD